MVALAFVEWRVDVPPPFLMEIGRRQREREPFAAASASIGSHHRHPRHPHRRLCRGRDGDGKEEGRTSAESITGWESGY